MGIAFVIISHFIFIAILGGLIGIIVSVIIYFTSNRENRNRNITIAIVSPIIGLYTFYICGLIGLNIVSQDKNIDIGIGDIWYVPLSNNCQLLFLDNTDFGYIKKNEAAIITEVTQIQEIGNKIFAKTNNNMCFFYNTKTNELKKFMAEQDLYSYNEHKSIKLIPALDFYQRKRNEIAGVELIFVGIVSFFISVYATINFIRRRISRYKPS